MNFKGCAPASPHDIGVIRLASTLWVWHVHVGHKWRSIKFINKEMTI